MNVVKGVISAGATSVFAVPFVTWHHDSMDVAARKREILKNFINKKQIHVAWEWGKIKNNFFIFDLLQPPHSLSFHSAMDITNQG